MVVDVAVLVAMLLFGAVVVVVFLFWVVGCADVLMCCAADSLWWLGLFVSFKTNQNHDPAGALPQLQFLNKKTGEQRYKKKHNLGPLMRVPNDAH